MGDYGTRFTKEELERIAESEEAVTDAPEDGWIAITGDGDYRTTTMSLRLPVPTLAALKHEALLRDTGATTLAREWIAERLAHTQTLESATLNVSELLTFLATHAHRYPADNQRGTPDPACTLPDRTATTTGDYGTRFTKEELERIAEAEEKAVDSDDDDWTMVTGDGDYRTTTMSLRLPVSMLAALKHEALLRDTGATMLARDWIAARLAHTQALESATVNVSELLTFLATHAHRYPAGQ